jgi:hypothetical protein
MAGKADFTEQEWDAMQKGVTGSAFLVALADRGFFDTFKEVGALGKYLSKAREKNPSPLIRELAGVRGTGFGLTSSPDEVEKGTTEALGAAAAALQAKAPDEVENYRSFVLEVAKAVGDAADNIDPKETGAIDKITAALQTAAPAQAAAAAPTEPATPPQSES